MEFIINQKELEKALDITASVASKKVLNPALQGTLIIAKQNMVEIKSSDTEVFVSITIPCEVKQEGSALLKTSLLRDIVKNFMAPEIKVHLNNGVLSLSSENTSYKPKLNVLSQESFPDFPEYKEENTIISLPSVEFKSMLAKTIPFAAKDDVRITFNSLLFDKEDMEFRLISSDTKRLSLIREHVTQLQEQFHFLVPIKTAQTLKDMLSKPVPLNVSLDNNLVIFKYDNIVLVSHLVEGNFPDYRAVIPSETPYIISFAKEDLLQALKTLSPFYAGDSQKITFTISSGQMLLETEETEIGKANNTMTIAYNGETLSLGFNFRYVQEILSVIDDANIIMKILNHDKPVIIQGETKTNDIFVCVPMK